MINWKKLKNKIPVSLKVKGKTWEVLWTEEFPGNKSYGETRFTKEQIVLLKDMGPKLTVHTMYHEFLHVLSEEYNIELTESQVLGLEKTFILQMNFFKELTSD